MEYQATDWEVGPMAQTQSSVGRGWTSRHPQIVGVLILIALHAFFVLGPRALSMLFPGAGVVPFGAWPAEWAGLKAEAGVLLIGIVQLLYVIPATLLALKLRHPAVATGIVKGAIVTFLVNLAGCGLMVWQLSKIG
jgi:hypothetical protein